MLTILAKNDKALFNELMIDGFVFWSFFAFFFFRFIQKMFQFDDLAWKQKEKTTYEILVLIWNEFVHLNVLQ